MEDGIGIWGIIGLLIVGMLFGGFILDLLLSVLGVTIASLGYLLYGLPAIIVIGALWFIFHKKE